VRFFLDLVVDSTDGLIFQRHAVLNGHISIQTTERYLGCKQRIQGAVNDKIGIEPSA
jgi:hypothetical protein